MKKLFLLFFCIMGLTVMANAQLNQKSPEQRAAHETKALQKALALTTDQATRVNAVLLTRANQMDSLKANPSGDQKGTHLTKKSIKIATDQQMMNILNPDQQKQYMQWEKMKEDKEREKKANTPPSSSPPEQG